MIVVSCTVGTGLDLPQNKRVCFLKNQPSCTVYSGASASLISAMVVYTSMFLQLVESTCLVIALSLTLLLIGLESSV
jgi:hypothetical protein